jgi:hypothetical protein
MKLTYVKFNVQDQFLMKPNPGGILIQTMTRLRGQPPARRLSKRSASLARCFKCSPHLLCGNEACKFRGEVGVKWKNRISVRGHLLLAIWGNPLHDVVHSSYNPQYARLVGGVKRFCVSYTNLNVGLSLYKQARYAQFGQLIRWFSLLC